MSRFRRDARIARRACREIKRAGDLGPGDELVVRAAIVFVVHGEERALRKVRRRSAKLEAFRPPAASTPSTEPAAPSVNVPTNAWSALRS